MSTRPPLRPIIYLISSLSIYGLSTSYYTRPKPDVSTGYWGGPSHYKEKKITKDQMDSIDRMSDKNRRVGRTAEEGFNRGESLGEHIGSSIVINLISFVITAGMRSGLYNNYHTIPTPAQTAFLNLLNAQDTKEEKDTILTVSNHTSTIDDPVIFGCILSERVKGSEFPHRTWGVNKLRWSLCTQEVCFKNPISATFFGAGRVLPIKRGAGIDQDLLHDFAAITVKGGEWIHIFPEGKIFQSGTLGRNYYNERSYEDRVVKGMGGLKWGVGKLIAHSYTKTRVFPIHHVGMEGVVPQYETGELKYKEPKGGNDVSLRFGEEIFFEDLIEEHERRHGKLWKVGDGSGRWKSNDDERELYRKITRRIEDSLIEIEKVAEMDDREEVRKGREGREYWKKTEQKYTGKT